MVLFIQDVPLICMLSLAVASLAGRCEGELTCHHENNVPGFSGELRSLLAKTLKGCALGRRHADAVRYYLEIINPDKGSQFTSPGWINYLEENQEGNTIIPLPLIFK